MPMFDLSSMEAIARDDALRSLGLAMTEIGWNKCFADLTEEEAKKIVAACIAGFSASMRDLEDGVPPF